MRHSSNLQPRQDLFPQMPDRMTMEDLSGKPDQWHRLAIKDHDLFLRGDLAEMKHRLRSLGHEPWTRLWAGSFEPGEVVYEIGANIGAMTLYFATQVQHGRVYAFEPGRFAFADLEANIAYNDLSNVTPVQAGVGAETTSALLQYSSTKPAGALHHWGPAQSGIETDTVDVVSVDGFAQGNEPPDHLFVDTDGYERDVLLGAKNSLRRVESLLCEFEDNADARSLFTVIEDAGLVEFATFRRIKRGAPSPWHQKLYCRTPERFAKLRKLTSREDRHIIKHCA